jgi:hypothetical protein
MTPQEGLGKGRVNYLVYIEGESESKDVGVFDGGGGGRWK